MNPGSDSAATQNGMRLHGLDGLRGLAALAVFGVHYNQVIDVDVQVGPVDLYVLMSNGEYGVALFFILSGFLLSQPFWKSILNGLRWPDTRTYIIRRLARIVPAYFGALTLLIILSGMWRIPAAYTDIALHYSFLFNLAEFSIFSINAPFWTLAVEMQFYILLPLIFAAIARIDKAWHITFIVALCVLAYAIHYGLNNYVTEMIDWPFATWLLWIRPHGAVLTHSLLAHLPHFLLGVIGAYLFLILKTKASVKDNRLAKFSDWVFGCTLIVVLVLLATPLSHWIQIPYGRYGLPLVTLLLVAMIVSVPSSHFACRILESFPLRGFGTISYGIYIYHLPCLTLVDHTMAKQQMDAASHWFLYGSLSLAVTILAASLSFLLIERPVLKWVRRRVKAQPDVH